MIDWWFAQTAQTHIAVGLLLGGLLLALVWRPGAKHTAAAAHQPQEDVSRPGNTGLLRRVWWKFFPPHDLMQVGGLAIDRTRKPHCAWLGPTGAGKSASVATVRMDGTRPTLCAMPDLSDPIMAACARLDGFRWTACESSVPVNFLIGTPTEVAERLTEVFRSGGVGAWKRTARMTTAQVIRALDINREPRTLHLIGTRLAEAAAADRELRTVCAGWVSRFLDLADQFGDSIGPHGVDLSELLAQGQTVVLDNDAFEHPSLGGDVVALGLAEAKRCANLVPGGFRLIFEEAGQLGDRIDLAEPFHRAGRRRRIAVDDLTQAESDLNEGISANIATRVYFAQELKSLQKIAADRLGLDYRKLDPANMPDFSAWIAHGKIRRLVRFPKPSSIRQVYPSSRGEGVAATDRRVSRHFLERSRPVLPALPPPSAMPTKLRQGLVQSGACLRWRADLKHTKDGYGQVWIEKTDERDGYWDYVHILSWEFAYGLLPRSPEGKRILTIDHHRTCPKDCCELTHLEPCTRGENSERRWRVRGS